MKYSTSSPLSSVIIALILSGSSYASVQKVQPPPPIPTAKLVAANSTYTIHKASVMQNPNTGRENFFLTCSGNSGDGNANALVTCTNEWATGMDNTTPFPIPCDDTSVNVTIQGLEMAQPIDVNITFA